MQVNIDDRVRSHGSIDHLYQFILDLTCLIYNTSNRLTGQKIEIDTIVTELGT